MEFRVEPHPTINMEFPVEPHLVKTMANGYVVPGRSTPHLYGYLQIFDFAWIQCPLYPTRPERTTRTVPTVLLSVRSSDGGEMVYDADFLLASGRRNSIAALHGYLY